MNSFRIRAVAFLALISFCLNTLLVTVQVGCHSRESGNPVSFPPKADPPLAEKIGKERHWIPAHARSAKKPAERVLAGMTNPRGERLPLLYAEPVEHISNAPIELPGELGIVQERFLGSLTSPLVIHIQESHSDPGVQKKISQILLYFQHTLGTELLAVEGASGDIPVRDLREFPSSPAKRAGSQILVDQLILDGPSYAAIFAPKPFRYVGVEDAGLYEAHRRNFQEVRNERARVEAFLAERGRMLEKERDKIVSAELKEFYAKENSFESGRISLDEWIRTLVSWAQQQNISLNDLVQIRILDRLMRNVGAGLVPARDRAPTRDAPTVDTLLDHPEIRRAMEEQELEKRLSADSFANELEILKKRLKEVLFVSKADRRLDQERTEFERLERVLRLKALNQDLAFGFQDSVPGLGQALEFYELAKRRDAVIAARFLRLLGGARTTAFLVTGGFHSQGLTKILRERGISYVVVTPRVEEFHPQETLYERRLRGDFEIATLSAPRAPAIPVAKNGILRFWQERAARAREIRPDRAQSLGERRPSGEPGRFRQIKSLLLARIEEKILNSPALVRLHYERFKTYVSQIEEREGNAVELQYLWNLFKKRPSELAPYLENSAVENLDTIVLDTETTGTSPVKDRVIEITAIRYHGLQEVDRFSTLIRPEPVSRVPWSIRFLTGISTGLLARKRVPGSRKAFHQFAAFLAKHPEAIFVANQALFDLAFIQEEFKRAGVPDFSFVMTESLPEALAKKSAGPETRIVLDAYPNAQSVVARQDPGFYETILRYLGVNPQLYRTAQNVVALKINFLSRTTRLSEEVHLEPVSGVLLEGGELTKKAWLRAWRAKLHEGVVASDPWGAEDRFKGPFRVRILLNRDMSTRRKIDHFGQVPDQHLFRLVISGRRYVWGVNRYPSGEGYSLLYEDLSNEDTPSPQLLDAERLLDLFRLQMRYPFIKIFFNGGTQAGATVPAFHAQIIDDHILPCEDWKRRKVTEWDGVGIYRLVKYPATVVVFAGGTPVRRAELMRPYLNLINQKEIPYNLVIGETGTTYLFLRDPKTGRTDLGGPEHAGLFMAMTEETQKKWDSEEALRRELTDLALKGEDFQVLFGPLLESAAPGVDPRIFTASSLGKLVGEKEKTEANGFASGLGLFEKVSLAHRPRVHGFFHRAERLTDPIVFLIRKETLRELSRAEKEELKFHLRQKHRRLLVLHERGDHDLNLYGLEGRISHWWGSAEDYLQVLRRIRHPHAIYLSGEAERMKFSEENALNVKHALFAPTAAVEYLFQGGIDLYGIWKQKNGRLELALSEELETLFKEVAAIRWSRASA